MVSDEQQGQRTCGNRHTDEPNALRTRVYKFYGKDRELVLPRQALKQAEVALTGGICSDDLIVKDCDLHESTRHHTICRAPSSSLRRLPSRRLGLPSGARLSYKSP